MSRINMNYVKAMNKINLPENLTTREKIAEMIDRMRWDVNHEHGEQLDHMQAHTYGGRTLKSYNTIVAYFDGVNVYELGSYSRTTSKQVTRFAEYHGADVIRISNPVPMLGELLTETDRERIDGGYTSLHNIFNDLWW